MWKPRVSLTGFNDFTFRMHSDGSSTSPSANTSCASIFSHRRYCKVLSEAIGNMDGLLRSPLILSFSSRGIHLRNSKSPSQSRSVKLVTFTSGFAGVVGETPPPPPTRRKHGMPHRLLLRLLQTTSPRTRRLATFGKAARHSISSCSDTLKLNGSCCSNKSRQARDELPRNSASAVADRTLLRR